MTEGVVELRLLGVAADDEAARELANTVFAALQDEGYDLDGVAPVLDDSVRVDADVLAELASVARGQAESSHLQGTEAGAALVELAEAADAALGANGEDSE